MADICRATGRAGAIVAAAIVVSRKIESRFDSDATHLLNRLLLRKIMSTLSIRMPKSINNAKKIREKLSLVAYWNKFATNYHKTPRPSVSLLLSSVANGETIVFRLSPEKQEELSLAIADAAYIVDIALKKAEKDEELAQKLSGTTYLKNNNFINIIKPLMQAFTDAGVLRMDIAEDGNDAE